MWVSQAAGFLGVAVIVVAGGGGGAPSVGDLVPAALGGVAGMIALAAFYRGLAIGTMSIVAPISATGAAVPVFVGLATGERPGALVLGGICLAVVGVVLAAREDAPEGSRQAAVARTSVLLALVAALGFGGFFVGLDASADEGVWWSLLAARVTSFSLLCVVVAGTRPPLPRDPRVLALIAAIGAVVTVLLARAVLGERVRRDQEAGIVAALVGVALIASGA
jgi:drug/metabolite transporter (DMT)-like permease